MRRVTAEGHATHWREDPGSAARLAETWWLGLRLADGIDPNEASRTAGADDAAHGRALELAEELVGHDLLEHRADGRVA
ncbi:MAG: hypothetical protein AAF957_28530, partial [Planctomycetota bacterium]